MVWEQSTFQCKDFVLPLQSMKQNDSQSRYKLKYQPMFTTNYNYFRVLAFYDSIIGQISRQERL